MTFRTSSNSTKFRASPRQSSCPGPEATSRRLLLDFKRKTQSAYQGSSAARPSSSSLSLRNLLKCSSSWARIWTTRVPSVSPTRRSKRMRAPPSSSLPMASRASSTEQQKIRSLYIEKSYHDTKPIITAIFFS